MTTHDNQGRAYAKLWELKPGNTVSCDGDFDCLIPWSQHVVFIGRGGLSIACKDGHHALANQADDGEHCIGIYPGVVTDPGASSIEPKTNVVEFRR